MSEAKTVREIRVNPVIPAESVLVATARGMRPKEEEKILEHDKSPHKDNCPFCIGNEDKTPPSIYSWPETGNWKIRIVENLYPVLGKPDSDTNSNNLNFGLQQAIEGYGHHEVVIDNANHGIGIHEMDNEHLARIFITYRNRMRKLYKNQKIQYVLVFKNFGPAAGASIKHTHSQIIAMPVVPQNIHDEVENSIKHFKKHGRCIFCGLIDEALTFETTIYDRESGKIKRKINVGQFAIDRTEHFIAIKPFASRFEWEVHILPIEHSNDYTKTSKKILKDLARIMRRTMQRLDAVIGGVQYNYFLHSVPGREKRPEAEHGFHWHLEIVPRTSIPTGFELGSGLFVNTICPEHAAQSLREVKLNPEKQKEAVNE